MYLLMVSIDGITPTIWRTILVPKTYTLNQLHHIIQISFGWTNSHLYMFGEYENKIGDLILWDDGETVSDREVKIEDELQEVGDKLKYEYDMGDGWKHTVILEKIEEGEGKFSKCLDGERSAPPEDCGGVRYYMETTHLSLLYQL